jgi:hypothetical protein
MRHFIYTRVERIENNSHLRKNIPTPHKGLNCQPGPPKLGRRNHVMTKKLDARNCFCRYRLFFSPKPLRTRSCTRGRPTAANHGALLVLGEFPSSRGRPSLSNPTPPPTGQSDLPPHRGPPAAPPPPLLLSTSPLLVTLAACWATPMEIMAIRSPAARFSRKLLRAGARGRVSSPAGQRRRGLLGACSPADSADRELAGAREHAGLPLAVVIVQPRGSTLLLLLGGRCADGHSPRLLLFGTTVGLSSPSQPPPRSGATARPFPRRWLMGPAATDAASIDDTNAAWSGG